LAVTVVGWVVMFVKVTWAMWTAQTVARLIKPANETTIINMASLEFI